MATKPPTQAPPTNSTTCTDVLNRLRRAEGQLRAVISMLEAGKDCDQVVTQLAATKAALDRAAVLFLVQLSTDGTDGVALDDADLRRLAVRLA